MNEDLRLLIVDDEEDLCEILQFNLCSQGYAADTACSAEEAIGKMQQRTYSLLLLDVMMDGMSGYQLAEYVRETLKSRVPIIFLTARGSESDLLEGFRVGADDYISKPFSLKEVEARVKAVLRRLPEADSGILEIGGLTINPGSKNVQLNGEPILLTRTEFEILLLLASSPNRFFSRSDILKKVWPDQVYVLDRTVDVHIARLRKKIGEYGRKIVNRSHYGYMFEL